jgi:hypothetical protein
MKLLLSLLTMLSSVEAHAAVAQGFCWAKTNSGVHCTAIKPAPSFYLLTLQCKQYGVGLGASVYGTYRNTDVTALQQKQEEGCNDVAGLSKYDCFLEDRCETPDGVTSSISPIHRSVFSAGGDTETARKACVSQAPTEYLSALSGAGAQCLVGARAVETLPKH